MKFYTFIVVFCICTFTAYAQNLISNPSFEDYDNCPTSFGQIACPLFAPPFAPTVKNWVSPVPNSPDYYNACSGSIYADVPANFYGYQPARTGNAYVGIVTLSGYLINHPNTMYLEYIETKLTSPLQAGMVYDVSCYVKLAFHIDQLHFINIVGLHELGASFSQTQYTSHTTPLSNSYVGMYRPGNIFITDTANWMKITAQYTATGGEEWLTIGRFNTGVLPLYQPVFPSVPAPSTTYQSYYLIDDVSVTQRPPCDTITHTHDTLICAPITSAYNIMSSGDTSGTFIWNTGANTPSILINQPGTYWCTATHDCNLVTDTFNVSILPDTIHHSENIALCQVMDNKLSARDNAQYYKWNTGDSTKDITINNFGKYWCTSIQNCKLFLDTFNVKTKALPIDFAPLDDINICNDELVTVGKQYPGVISYQWSNGDSTCCITPQQSGTYTINIISDCDKFSDTFEVNIERCTDCLFIPNVFSPNADGLNDYFGVRSLCNSINNFKISIYNRWGQQVFTSNDINFRWNGLQKADYAEIGSYYYYAEYSTVTKTEIQHQKGDITLVR